MKIYISGKITGNPDFKEQFAAAEEQLREDGHAVLNPAALGQGGFKHEEYLHIGFAMIDVCNAIYMLDTWKDSPGAKAELAYAFTLKKKVM